MQKIKITQNDNNKRIDKFLISFYNLPKSVVMKKFRQKDVRVNGVKIKNHSYLLKTGDEITTYFTEVKEKVVNIPKSDTNIDVVYEDSNILLVNKPAGILVSGESENNLHSQVLAYLDKNGKIPENTSYQPINIHRLDKNTTGIVIFSLNYNAHRILSKAIATEGMVNKFYLTKVQGRTPEKLILEDKIAHNENHQKMVINKRYGKLAKLEAYKVKFAEKERTILEVKLITGRKHQIRLQLSNAGFPIVGDPRYGGPKAEYINLCAYKISFSNLKGDLDYLNNHVYTIKKPNWI